MSANQDSRTEPTTTQAKPVDPEIMRRALNEAVVHMLTLAGIVEDAVENDGQIDNTERAAKRIEKVEGFIKALQQYTPIVFADTLTGNAAEDIITAPGDYVTRSGERVTIHSLDGKGSCSASGYIWKTFRGKYGPRVWAHWQPDGRFKFVGESKRDIVGPYVAEPTSAESAS